MLPQLTSLQANAFQNLVANFLQVSPRKIEKLISGGFNKRGVGKFFEKNKREGDAYFAHPR